MQGLTRPLYALLCFFIMSAPLIGSSIESSEDGELYLGVGEYFLSTGHYLDVVRHDEILPSVGHVLYATILGRLGPSIPFVIAFLSFSISLAYIVQTTKIQQLFGLFTCFILSNFTLKYVAVGGIESSLIFSISLLIASTTRFITSPTKASIALWGASFFWMLLVRPVYAPVLLPIMLCAGLYAYRSGMQTWSILSVIPMVLWAGVWAVSTIAYGDGRLVTGTYSSIPLYSGFNSHINLKHNYGSRLWRVGEAEAGLEPTKNTDGWKKRDERLKTLVVDFVINNPAKAIGAYAFRLTRFFIPYKQERLYASIMIAAWFGTFLLILFRSWRYSGTWTLAAIVAFGLNISWAAASALFVYAGSRYLIANYTMSLLVLSLQLRVLNPSQIFSGNQQ